MKKIIVKTRKKTIERTNTFVIFEYEFQDSDGFKVKGENIGTEKDLMREIEIKTRRLKAEVVIEPLSD